MADASAAGAGQQIQYAAVIERHGINGNVGLGFVSGFGLKGGALASTVSHDSHNLVIVGCSPEEMELAAKTVASMGGGLAAVRDGEVLAKLPLEVAGLMSLGNAGEVAGGLRELHAAALSLGCPLPSPFMTLAFIALPVIPSLKLTDKGLVDVDAFKIVPLRGTPAVLAE
jgi:adenine deaminase